MARVLEDRGTHATVLNDNGEVELISWSSPTNVLIYKHGLADVVKHGTETWEGHSERYGDVKIEPQDNAASFIVTFDDERFSVPAHEKAAFVSTLKEMFGDADDGEVDFVPLSDFIARINDTLVNPLTVKALLDLPLFETVEPTMDGWLINDIVLLTYDNEFYQPKTRRTNRTGEVVEGGSRKIAYEVNFSNNPHRDLGQTLLGEYSRHIEDEDTVEFITRAIWAVTYVSEEVTPNG